MYSFILGMPPDPTHRAHTANAMMTQRLSAIEQQTSPKAQMQPSAAPRCSIQPLEPQYHPHTMQLAHSGMRYWSP